MKDKLRKLCIFLIFSTASTVIMDSRPESEVIDEEPRSFTEAFGVCLSSKVHGILECINRGALSTLQLWNEKDKLDFGEMCLERSEGQGRDLLDLDYDPQDFGNILRAASRLMEQRNLKWDLGNLYPGLQMRVGPTLNGNGILEFVLDERVSKLNDRQVGTGRTLIKQILLPFLLGFKFNLTSLIPLIFGIILFITKKALILTKIAVILTGLLGWKTMFSVPHDAAPVTGEYHVQHGGSGYFHHDPYLYQQTYGAIQNPGITPYGHVIREVVDVYEHNAENERSERNSRSGRNFVWVKDD